MSMTQQDREALQRFGKAIDAVRIRVEAQLGADDVAHVVEMRRWSRAMEVIGRGLIHVSIDPLTFVGGVGALWVHKQLEATEIGHTALHGAFDGLPGAEAFQSKTFAWDAPIDEESWRYAHNVRHHQYTNIAGKDPDIHFGPVRLTANTPHRPIHYVQVPYLALEWGMFLLAINLHVTGVIDAIAGNGRPEEFDFLPDRSKASVRGAWRKALRKLVPHHAREYLLFPALAGPMWWKVMAGNWLAARIRDVYSAATIYCGHVGPEVAAYPEGSGAHGRGEWYKMQIEAANDFEVPRWVSLLCGGLDKQIEHHLFPKFPAERLREIAPEIKAICEAHGVAYRTDTWGRTLAGVMRKLVSLSVPQPEDRAAAAAAAAPVAIPITPRAA